MYIRGQGNVNRHMSAEQNYTEKWAVSTTDHVGRPWTSARLPSAWCPRRETLGMSVGGWSLRSRSNQPPTQTLHIRMLGLCVLSFSKYCPSLDCRKVLSETVLPTCFTTMVWLEWSIIWQCLKPSFWQQMIQESRPPIFKYTETFKWLGWINARRGSSCRCPTSLTLRQLQ